MTEILLVDGTPVAKLLLDEEKLNQVLIALNEEDGIDLFDGRQDLIALLERIGQGYSGEDIPEVLRGISGWCTVLFCRAWLFEEKHKISGRIRDYIFVNNTQSGHLAVDMNIESYFCPLGKKVTDSHRVEFLHWDIEIKAGGYKIHHRKGVPCITDKHYPDNPFPEVDLALPPEATDPDDHRSIWYRDLDHKLHANNKEEIYIEIRNVFQQIDGGSLTRLDDGHHHYTSTKASCIDILFAGSPPASQLPTQLSYCLGRCKHPDIVNTSGG